MRKTALIIILLFSLLKVTNIYSQYSYPQTRTVDSSNTYFGEKIEDPYQWLEDLKSNEVKDWFKSQADYTTGILSKISNRDKLVDEMKENDKVKSIKYSSLAEHNGRYFFLKRLPGEEDNKLFYRTDISGEDILLFDPMTYQEGKNYNLGGWEVSRNGKNILMNITESGKERPLLKILNVDTKTFYPEEYKATYASGWVDNSDNVFMYLKLQSDDVHDVNANLDSKVMLHKIGDPQTGDRELLSRVHDPDLNIKPEEYPFIFSYDYSDYYFAGKSSVDNNEEFYFAPKSDLQAGKFNWKKLTDKSDEVTSLVADKNDVYLLSSKDASNFKITKTSLLNPDVKNASLVFSGGDKKIESLNSSKDYLIITQLLNGIETYFSKLDFNTGKIENIELPVKGYIEIQPYSTLSNACYVYNSNWTTPSNLYDLDLETNNFTPGPFNLQYTFPGIENIVSEEIEVPSYDGAMVPLSIIYDKTKMNKDGNNICYLDGYGAYGYTITPYFNTPMLPLIKRGVVYAIAHVRGGGEKGEDWYRAGWKTTKPNTWKDFIACAEYLEKNGYTSKDKLAGSGTSAGGVLIGRAITERPDLFRVAIPKVGCLNTLRAEFTPNGPVNVPEFGTVAIKEEFEALKEMDAYQHLKQGEKYPATLITTGFNDPRVISWIPAKFAAKLQNVNSSGNPVLLEVDYTTGHFGGETMSDYFKNLADIYSFVMWQCGDSEFQPGL